MTATVESPALLSAVRTIAREVSAAEIARAEAEANRIVWEDRPVTIRFVTEQNRVRLKINVAAATASLITRS